MMSPLLSISRMRSPISSAGMDASIFRSSSGLLMVSTRQ